jgi:hypothetical protein
MRAWMAVAAGLAALFAREASAWACLTDLDCSGTTPICAAGTCVACSSNLECTTADPLTPNCNTGGGSDNGSCFSCVTSPDECQAPTPLCELGSALCVACLTSSDCTGSTPVCSITNGQCLPCQGDYGADGGVIDCSDPSLPACQLADAGALAGECTQCSSTDTSLCGGDEPVCVTSLGDCGCTADSECAKGDVCDPIKGPAGECVVGCRASPDDCGTGLYCDVPDGGTIGSCEPGCKTSADCSAPTPACDVSTHQCEGGGSGDAGSHDGSSSDGSSGDGSPGDGGAHDGSPGDGSSRDGSSTDGSSSDGSSGDGGGHRDAGKGIADAGGGDGGGPSMEFPGGILEGGGCDCSVARSGGRTYAAVVAGLFLALLASARRRGRGTTTGGRARIANNEHRRSRRTVRR